MTVFENGYPGKEQDRWCLRRPRAEQTLCGRLVDTLNAEGYFPSAPALQPSDPGTQCRPCAVKLAELKAARGVCRLCGGEVALIDGRIGPHGDCAGVNMKPRGAR